MVRAHACNQKGSLATFKKRSRCYISQQRICTPSLNCMDRRRSILLSWKCWSIGHKGAGSLLIARTQGQLQKCLITSEAESYKVSASASHMASLIMHCPGQTNRSTVFPCNQKAHEWLSLWHQQSSACELLLALLLRGFLAQYIEITVPTWYTVGASWHICNLLNMKP